MPRLPGTDDDAAAQPQRPRTAIPWLHTEVACAAAVILIVGVLNLWLVYAVRVGAILVSPVLNLLLAAILLGCAGIVRRITGTSAVVHIWTTVVCCAAATIIGVYIAYGLLESAVGPQ